MSNANHQLLMAYLRRRMAAPAGSSMVTEQVWRGGHLVGYAESITRVKSNEGATEYLADFVPSRIGLEWIGTNYLTIMLRSYAPQSYIVEAPVFSGLPFTLYRRLSVEQMKQVMDCWQPDWTILQPFLELVSAVYKLEKNNAQTRRASSGSTAAGRPIPSGIRRAFATATAPTAGSGGGGTIKAGW